MSKFIRFYYSLSKSFLNPVARYAILELQKEQPPQYKGLANKKIEIPRYRPSIQGGFSIAHYWDFIEKRYLQLTKIKVSNAIMNIPKVIRSLNSYFIRTTSHLCMMEGQRPCSDTIVPCHFGNISHFYVQLFFLTTSNYGSTTFSRNSLMFYFQFIFSKHSPYISTLHVKIE